MFKALTLILQLVNHRICGLNQVWVIQVGYCSTLRFLFLGGLSLHLNHLYSIAHDNLRLAIWDTSCWTFLVKFGHKGP